tara:strand:- start:705 stop:815 length:111 start_codon:yes stop_codon:yes gene_type:complete
MTFHEDSAEMNYRDQAYLLEETIHVDRMDFLGVEYE